MTINNFQRIRDFISFTPQDFYYLQILKRRKENPDMRTGVQVIKTYFIDSFELFDKVMPDIIRLCEDNNARAYFSMNKRNYKKTTLYLIKYLTDLVIAGQEHAARKGFELVAGKHAADPLKKWILDVDIKDEKLVDDIISDIADIEPKGPRVYLKLPTKNGWHIICKPFDPRAYKDMHPDHEIHKDSPTLLYIP